MSRTGKNEQNANYYLIAANGFIKEYKMKEGSVQEGSDRTDTSVTRTRGGRYKGVGRLKNVYLLSYVLILICPYSDIKVASIIGS